MLSINKNKQLSKNDRIKFYMMVITSSRGELQYCSQQYLNIRMTVYIMTPTHTQVHALKRRRVPVHALSTKSDGDDGSDDDDDDDKSRRAQLAPSEKDTPAEDGAGVTRGDSWRKETKWRKKKKE